MKLLTAQETSGLPFQWYKVFADTAHTVIRSMLLFTPHYKELKKAMDRPCCRPGSSLVSLRDCGKLPSPCPCSRHLGNLFGLVCVMFFVLSPDLVLGLFSPMGLRNSGRV